MLTIRMICILSVVMSLFTAHAEEKYTVVIDSGHGGKNRGAVYGDLVEKDLTLVVGRKLRALFAKDEDIRTVFTRSDDRYVTIRERINLINSTNPDFFISIHFNFQPFLTSSRGFEIYYVPDDFSGPPDVSFDRYHRTNRSFLIGRRFKKRFLRTPIYRTWGLYLNMFVPKNGLPLFNETNVPGILLEIAYLSSPDDRACVEDPDFLTSMTWYIYTAVKDSLTITTDERSGQ